MTQNGILGLTTLCRMGQVDEARALLSKIPNPNTVLYNTLINGYVASGRFEEAKYLMYQNMVIASFEPDAFTFNIMINGLCKKGYLVSALEFLNEMVEKGFEPNLITYTILINGFCKQGRFEEDSEVVNEDPILCHSVSLLNKALGLSDLWWLVSISKWC